MNRSDSIAELAKALTKAQAEMKGAVKDSTNPAFRSRYADLASVWDACREPLTKHGLCVVQTTEESDSGVVVETTLLHSSGEWISGRLRMQPVKSDPQGIGSVLTYMRRYSLAAMVGIAPEDDDGEAAMGRGKSPSQPDAKGSQPYQPQQRYPEPEEKTLVPDEDAKIKLELAASVGIEELSKVWRRELTEEQRASCAGILPDLKKKAMKALPAGPAITEEQTMDLCATADEQGVEVPRLLKYLGYEKLSDIPAAKYDEALKAIPVLANRKNAAGYPGDPYAARARLVSGRGGGAPRRA